MSLSYNTQVKVAVPWNLTHYIPLNGFHPLYRPLFESAPKNITFSIWDNVLLSNYLRNDLPCRKLFLKICQDDQSRLAMKRECSKIQAEHLDSLYDSNYTLTKLLDGDIEFHHTAPHPSMTRPFVFHCESFAPIFFPFAHQGTGNFLDHTGLKEYYQSIFENELCLGIFSHLQETLDSISLFFQSAAINQKLVLSRVGLSDTIVPAQIDNFNAIEELKFFFMNSAHQNPKNFFNRGGHIVLRFFEYLYAQKISFKAYMRCSKPSDELLQEYGVDIICINNMTNTHIIWIETYLTDNEMNSLIKNTHFTLLPSHSLHSVPIMHAMRSGSIPIVTDTIGTSLYVKDGHNGVILTGMYQSYWQKDTHSGIMFDTYHQDTHLDNSLVEQLFNRVMNLWSHPNEYNTMRNNAIETSKIQFSAQAFASSFWEHIGELKQKINKRQEPVPLAKQLFSSYHSLNTITSLFESPPQPVKRIFTGDGYIVELSDTFVYVKDTNQIPLHGWSIVSEYTHHTPSLLYANSIKELVTHLMVNNNYSTVYKKHMMIKKISRKLESTPKLKKPIKVLYKCFLEPFFYFEKHTIVKNISQRLNQYPKLKKPIKAFYRFLTTSYSMVKKTK